MDLVKVGIDAAVFILKLTLFIYIGLFLAYIACKREKILRIGFIFNPLVKFGKLPRCCSFYFLMSMVNSSSALPTLLGFYKQGLVNDDKQVIGATITAGLPLMLESIAFTGPIAIGLLGLKNGILFLAVFASIGLIEALIGIVYGRTMLSERGEGHDCDFNLNLNFNKEKRGIKFKGEVKEAFKESYKMLLKILKILVPLVFLIYFITNSEVIMHYITEWSRPIALIFPIGSETLPVAIISAVNIFVGLNMAQELIVNGMQAIEVFTAIIVGMFLFNFFDLFISFIPYNVSFFGRKLGLKVGLASFLAVGASELAVIMLLWCVKGIV